MYCQECGEGVPDGARSCPSCGVAVHSSEQQPPSGPGGQTPQQTRSTSARGLLSSVSVIGGIVYGTASFVTTFVVTVVLVFTELESETNDLGLYAGDQILALLGWFFYNAHTVGISNSATGTTVNVLESAYQSAGSAASVPKLAYYALPVAVLFVLGYVLADRASPSDASPFEGAVAGASIAIGYGVLAFLAGTSVFTITEAGASAGPQTGAVVMMMVVLYPGLVGGVAGYLSRA